MWTNIGLISFAFILLGSGFTCVQYFLYSSTFDAIIFSDTKSSIKNLLPAKGSLKFSGARKNTANIIILSSGRSGSSFLGEIFKRNKEKTTYIFEPLRNVISGVFVEDYLKFKAIKVIHELFMCRSTTDQHKKLTRDTSVRNKPLEAGKSKACSGNKCIVVKELTLRLPENGSSVLENLIKHSKSLNMRIVHLVRDPRHVISSMKRLGWISGNGTSQELQISFICKAIWSNLHYGQKNYPQLKDRYKLVVFRNLMMNPYETARTLYEFAGIGAVPPKVRAWIKSSTNGKGSYESQPFTTTRNTTRILHQKMATTKHTSRIVQEHCGNIIRFIEELHKTKTVASVEKSPASV